MSGAEPRVRNNWKSLPSIPSLFRDWHHSSEPSAEVTKRQRDEGNAKLGYDSANNSKRFPPAGIEAVIPENTGCDDEEAVESGELWGEVLDLKVFIAAKDRGAGEIADYPSLFCVVLIPKPYCLR